MEGLNRLREDALHIAVNTAKPQALRDEACGIVKTVDVILGVPAELAGLHKLLQQAKEKEQSDAVV